MRENGQVALRIFLDNVLIKRAAFGFEKVDGVFLRQAFIEHLLD